MRSAPPPDFRYVGLEPAPSKLKVLAIAAVTGLGALLFGLVLGGSSLHGVVLSFAAGLTLFLAIARRRIAQLSGVEQQCPIGIVPWGVVVYADDVRVLRWSTINTVNVSSIHGMDQKTPFTRYSVVKIATERETFGGYAAGGVSLERLEVHLSAYSEQAARVLALDLAGTHAVSLPLEPACEQLIDEARFMISSGRLSEKLLLAPLGYRAAGDSAIPEYVVGELRTVLESCNSDPDPRALAAILVAELELYSLTDAILALTNSPHATLAAVARAAALRLGCDVQRVGALEEAADFVPSDDLAALRAWARAPDLRSGTGRVSSNAA